jgi:hypothetical protein
MNFLHQLADLITGGALTESQQAYSSASYERDRYRDALRDIVAMNTPRPNATVQRMVETAQVALEIKTVKVYHDIEV